MTGKSGHFWEWIEFFQVCGMPFRASYYRQQAEKGAYFIAQSPCHFDAAFQPRGTARPRDDYVTPERRLELIAKVKAMFSPMPRRGRHEKDDPRAAPPAPPEVRELTDAEVESMRRMIGERTL